jgi:hypothetical protein
MVPVVASSRRASVAIVVVLALGCGGKSIYGDDTYAAGNSAGSELDRSASSSGGNGGTAPRLDECIVFYPDLELTACETLEGYVSVHDAVVVDTNGDGRASPGERLRISVTFSEVSGLSGVAYPGVDFQTLGSGITLDPAGFNGPVSYWLGACESIGGVVDAILSPSLESGSLVHVVARAASLNQDCPNAAELVIPIVVGAPAS